MGSECDWLQDLLFEHSALVLGVEVVNSTLIVEIGMVGLIGGGSSAKGSLSIESCNDSWFNTINGSLKTTRLSALGSVESVTVSSCLSFPEKIHLHLYKCTLTDEVESCRKHTQTWIKFA